MCLSLATPSIKVSFVDGKAQVYKVLTTTMFSPLRSGFPPYILGTEFVSNRLNKKLSKYEEDMQEVQQGCHVFNDLKTAQRFTQYNSLCIVECRALQEDLVAEGVFEAWTNDYSCSVFMKLLPLCEVSR